MMNLRKMRHVPCKGAQMPFCIVVEPRIFRGKRIGAGAGTDSLHLVGRHGKADAGAAEKQRLLALSGDNRLAGGLRQVRVVAGLRAEAAEILVGDAFFVQMLLDFFL